MKSSAQLIVQLFDAELARILRAADVAAVAHGEPLIMEHKIEHRGQRFEFGATRLLVGAQAGTRDLCVIWHDLSPERQSEQQLRHALDQLEQNQRSLEQMRREMQDHQLRDSSTGLYSRAHFDDQLKREIDLSSREQRQFALVVIEIDALRDDVRALGEAGDGAGDRATRAPPSQQHTGDGCVVPVR